MADKPTETAPGVPLRILEASTLSTSALAPQPVLVQPTQLRRPWRATARTVFAAVVGFAALLPLLVQASGVDQTLPAVAGAVAVAGAITRIMAIPQVETFLRTFLPFLAASPKE
jgi:ABC-type uncharacterized transport system permease subunit